MKISIMRILLFAKGLGRAEFFMKQICRLVCCAVLALALAACAPLGIEGPFRNDPLTGGINASISELLNITLPAGLQRYPSHGFVRIGENGRKEGLETFRGNMDGVAANLNIFNSLHQKGWQLRLSLRKGDRSIAIYENAGELALVAFHRQGMLTILEIWAGPRLGDGAVLSAPGGNMEDEPESSIAGEEYGPIDGRESKEGVVEKWGGGLEEREL